MKAIVIAGGHEELGPLTFEAPLVTLPLAGKPLVACLLDQLAAQGIESAAVTSYRWPHVVEAAVERRTSTLPVTAVLEHPPFGSANMVAQVAAHWEEPFLVVMGEVVVDLDISAAAAFHKERGALITVVVCESEPPCRYGEIAADRQGAVVMAGSEQLVLRDGPRTANAGVYIMSPEILKHIPQDKPFSLDRDLLPLLVEHDLPVAAFNHSGYWHSVSNVEDYRQVNMDALNGRVPGFAPLVNQLAPGIWAGVGAEIDPRAQVRPPVLVDAGCTIERDAVVGPDAILGPKVLVKRGAEVSGSVVLANSKVGLATRLQDAVVRGNVLIRRNNPQPTYVDDRQVLETVQPLDWRAVLRNVVERAMALGALVVLSPLLLLIALIIKLDSPGPVFYTQLRVGQGKRTTTGQYRGRIFELAKFRTMRSDADDRLKEVLSQNEYGGAPFVKIRNDPRITRVGRLLRASSLDELPQLFNVLRGDLGLVGNRPLPLYEAEQLSHEWQQVRFSAPAGITGLWQISGRSDLSAEERMVLDNYYALTHSFWSDLRILLITLPALVARRGAR